MPSSLFLLIFNVCLLFIFIDLTISINDHSILQLSVDPVSGFLPENIEIRCQILEPSVYDNVYLSVKTDNVKPSGILLMKDSTTQQCRLDKFQYIRVDICNSSLILIHINHQILNDSLHTIRYSCSQGDVHVFSSYRISKDQTARYYDSKSTNSSSSLTHTLCLLLLLLFVLLTIGKVR